MLFLPSRRQFLPVRLAKADFLGWFPGRTPRVTEQVQLAQGGYFLMTYAFAHLRAKPRLQIHAFPTIYCWYYAFC